MPRYAGTVTGNHSDLPKLPLRLSPLQILGLQDPDECDWARLRGLQYAEIHTVALMRIASQALAGLIAVTLFAATTAWSVVSRRRSS